MNLIMAARMILRIDIIMIMSMTPTVSSNGGMIIGVNMPDRIMAINLDSTRVGCMTVYDGGYDVDYGAWARL